MSNRFVILIGVALCLLAPFVKATTSHCVFHKVQNGFQGSCGTFGGATPVLSMAPTDRITSGVWRKDIHPREIWAGVMTDEFSRYPREKDPMELEIFGNGRGVLRTQSGWFPVTGFTANPTPAFDLDANHEVAPSALDVAIVRQTAHILSSKTTWNRAENRKCPASAKTWSIYCAMEKATIEVTRAFHHRRPALEVVRIIIDERSANRPYHHRLMDYNNDRSTTLVDVQSLFRDAAADMKNPTWLTAHGFAPPGKY